MPIVSSGQLTLTDLNDTKQLILYLNANYRTQIYDPNGSGDTAYSPNFKTANLVITPELYIAGGDGSNLLPNAQVKSLTWYEGTQTTTAIPEAVGADYTVPTGTASTTAKPLTVKTNFTAKNNQIFTCVVVYTDPDTLFDITLKANIDIVKITNGQKGATGVNAITAFTTNSAVTLPATNAGAVSVFTGSGQEIYVYDGTTPLTFLPTGTAGNGQFTISTTIAPASGVTLATPTAGTSPNRAIYGNITAFATGNDVVTVTYNITGKTSAGTAFTTSVIQTFGKIKQALDGTTPTTYWMTVSSPVIQKTVGGAFSPTSITATGYKQTGTGTPVSDASYKFRIDYDNGSGFVTGTPTGAVATATTTAYNAGLKAIRIRMYLSSVTPSDTNFIDEQIVMVVSDGATGANAFFLNVWTPDGDTTRNGSGTLKIRADLYEGGTQRTPSAYKWYIQDPTATTSSGGDTDGGAGWRLLNSTTNFGVTNYTTAEITVPASAIAGVEGFKCVATYSTLNPKPSGLTVVKDFTDPITVTITGANIFKNGEGSVTLKAQLMQAGANIASTGYTFAWSIYKTNGTLHKTLTGTTDTITVNATDIDGIGNVVCDVSK